MMQLHDYPSKIKEDNIPFVMPYIPPKYCESDIDSELFVKKAGDETITGNKTISNIMRFGTSPILPTYTEGQIYWDAENHTLAIRPDVSDIIQQVGQEIYIRVRNNTNETIRNGKVCKLTGALGQLPTIGLAQANTRENSRVIGVATHDIEKNTNGHITLIGLVNDINTGAFNDGDIVFLSATEAGALTKTAPTNPNYAIMIGYISHSHITQGKLSVNLHQSWSIQASFYNLDVNNQLHAILGKLGGLTHYTNFEADGTMQAIGDATCWDDLLPSSVTVGSGVNAPAFTSYNGNLRAYEFVGAVQTKELNMGFQMSHTREANSSISPHIHLYIPDDVSGGVIKFGLEYTWTSINDVGAISTNTIYGTVTRTANQGINNNAILKFPDIVGTNKGLSSLLMCRLFRNAADSEDTFGSSVWLKSSDIHIIKDMLGSRQEYIK